MENCDCIWKDKCNCDEQDCGKACEFYSPPDDGKREDYEKDLEERARAYYQEEE